MTFYSYVYTFIERGAEFAAIDLVPFRRLFSSAYLRIRTYYNYTKSACVTQHVVTAGLKLQNFCICVYYILQLRPVDSVSLCRVSFSFPS